MTPTSSILRSGRFVGHSVWASVLACMVLQGQLCCARVPTGPSDRTTDKVSTVKHDESSFLAPPGRLPYLVSIRRPGTREHVCSGVLIHPRYVLTTAHCVDPASQYSAGANAILHVGLDDIDQMGGSVEIQMTQRTFIHDKFNPEKLHRSPYNVALLKLPRASKHPVPMLLADHFKLQTGQKFMAAGWGFGGDGPSLGDKVFSGLRLEVQEFVCGDNCNRTMLWNGSICKDLTCGLNQQHQASCVVDSGSPMLLLDMPGYNIASGTPTLDFVIGVNVDGAACGTTGKPDIYVDIRAHGLWMQSVLDMEKVEL